jgi:L-amino acid N-acyltransferase YncA
MLVIREAQGEDREQIWSILQPALRSGEAYALPTDTGREEALAYWYADRQETFVATDRAVIRGTYYLRTHQYAHARPVASCGLMTAATAQGEVKGRDVARAMLEHSLKIAKAHGFRALQFNFVIGSNIRAMQT